MNIKITGSGSYVPEIRVKNTDFGNHVFLNEDGTPFAYANEVVIDKFKSITGIEERRYAEPHLTSSDLAFFAAEKAIKNANIDPETIDYIILAHNFGDVKPNAIQSDTVPSLATRVKHKLQIKNPKCVAYDILFGCPGWIEGVLQANAFIKSGMAKRCLVIGAETLSRVVDKHDRDSMIYSDGAGASILEGCDDNEGLLSYESATFAYDEANYLYFGNSFNKDLVFNVCNGNITFGKASFHGLWHLTQGMKSCLDKSGIPIGDIKKVLIHQANEKMDEAIVHRFFKLYHQEMPDKVMPMSITLLGNSSVATIPTLFDLLVSDKIEGQKLHKGDVIIFASVGAGMNVNAFVYKY